MKGNVLEGQKKKHIENLQINNNKNQAESH